MLKIGDVARLNGISVDTVRYYDKIGLFPADKISESGYRYYYPESLMKLDTILWLRSNGLPLEEIRKVVESNSSMQLYDIMQNRIAEIKTEIQKLHQQLEICTIFSGHMKLANEYPESIPYFLSYPNRYYVLDDISIDPRNKAEYELGIKRVFPKYSDKFYFYNSFYGGIYPIDPQKDMIRKEFHVAVFNIGDTKDVSLQEMKSGIYAVMPVYGFNTIEESFPILQSYIYENHYHICSDCYVLKIWEQNDGYNEEQELLQLQVRVEKK